MAAAAGAGAGAGATATIEEKIKDAYESADEKGKMFALTFKIGDIEFTTRLRFSEQYYGNKCIMYNARHGGESFIRADSGIVKCFEPPLTVLPEGITQTDVLQVLSTKLKKIIFDEVPPLLNAARLINKVTKREINLRFSLWRLARGEKTLYEKYGYTNKHFENFRQLILNTKWDVIKNTVLYDSGDSESPVTLEALLQEKATPLVISHESTIADVMKQITYETAQTLSVVFRRNRYYISEMVIDALALVFKDKIYATAFSAKRDDGYLFLELNEESDEWKRWNTVVQLIAFEAVSENAAATKRRRRNRRTQTMRRGRRNA